jgi:transposase InsO family protein
MSGLMLSSVSVSSGEAMPIVERTIVDQREEMVLRALDERYSVTEVAALYGVTRPTVRLWRDRYRASGRAGLVDLSHAPHQRPLRTSELIEQLIVAERETYGWGSKKILQRLREAHPELELPRRSTVDAVLARKGLVQAKRRRSRLGETPFRKRYHATEPGELMAIDHKGEFLLRTGKYCYPLTIADPISRYLLACEALGSTRFEEAWPVVERVFRQYGLPIAMQSDNGPPFGTSIGRVSRFSVHLMIFDVLPVFGRPGHPQDNGRLERVHRDVKREATRPPCASLREQQIVFNEFVRRFNVERPHEAIGMQRPINVHKPSPRPFPRRRPKPAYAAHVEKRKVTDDGYIKWQNKRIFLGDPLAGQTVGIEPKDDALCSVQFFNFTIGMIDERTNQFL